MYVQRHVLVRIHHRAREPVHEAHGIVREHDPFGVAALAKSRHGVNPFLECDAGQSEMVESEIRPVVDQAQVVVGVDGAAAVADDDP